MEATSGVLEGLLALPEGGGALRGLGERFQPDLLRGTGNYSVPIKLPKGPGGFSPSLSLRYSTGQGNGPFGMGWQLVGPVAIRRRTDRGIPTYDDATDEFTWSGAETLVPVGGGRYRPRADTQFWDIRRDGAGWRVRTRDGHSYSLGTTADSRIVQGPRVFAWQVDRETDAAGNQITYQYERDGAALYLSEIAWSQYRVRFIYEVRPDPLHDGRAGFAVRTARRCAAIERRCEGLAQPLLARYSLQYSEAAGTRLSLLTAVHLTGVGADGVAEEYPAVRFHYTQHQPGAARYQHIGAADAPPPPLDEPGTTLVDMDGDGLPDVLATGRGEHRCWPNRGDGSFGPPRPLPLVPSGLEVGQPGVSFVDMNGDGAPDLVRVGSRLAEAVAGTGAGGWAPRSIIYGGQLPLRLSGRATRLTDLDGDGVVDLLQSGPEGFLLTYNRGAAGWSRPVTVPRRSDPAEFPAVNLGDAGVLLADMTGDGLADIAFVASGRVEYWPYYGYGQWGQRVRMQSAPLLPAGYNPDRLFLSDLDGDGAADLIYVDFDRVHYWLNQSGVGWSGQYTVPFVPPPNPAALHMADLLGTGTRGLVWSGRERSGATAGYRYLDLSGGVKPYLLTRIDSGLGGVSEIAYTTTAALRAADAAAGQPWASFLPFPLHVVSELVQTDQITGRETRTRLRYHRGYYDGPEADFRGFERVESEQVGDAHEPTLLQETVYFLGAMAGPLDEAARPAAVRARERALSGSPLQVRTYAVAGDGTRTLHQSAEMTWEARLEVAGGIRSVHFPHLVRTESRDCATGEPDRISLAEYGYDAYGNLSHKRQVSRFATEPEAAAAVTDQVITYTAVAGPWLVGLPASIQTRDGAGRLLNDTRHYYDGPAFVGLGTGEATAGLLRRTEELVLADWALPSGYAAHQEPGWGLHHDGEGWYRTTVAYSHDGAGNVVAQRDALGAERSVTYDADALFPLQLTDADGPSTHATFDPRSGQPLEVRLPSGAVTRYHYSPLGRLQAQYETAPDGTLQLTQVFLTDCGDATAAPPRPARVVSLRPLTAGRTLAECTGAADPAALAGFSIACDFYDGSGNLLQRLRQGADAPDGTPRWLVTRRRDYTCRGQTAADYPNAVAAAMAFDATAPVAAPVSFYYGPGGQVLRTEQPDGGRLAARYLWNRVEKRDALTADGDQPVVERYNARGHLIVVEQPDGSGAVAITRYEVDALGRTERIIDAGGRVLAAYTFAGPGAPLRINHADAGERTYWFDALGHLRRRTDSLGRCLRLDYDLRGRLTTATDASDPAHPVVVRSLTYAGTELQEVQEGEVTVRFAYDMAGHATERTVDLGGGQVLILQREYGLLGEVQAVIYPDGTRVEYAYDAGGSPVQASGFVDDVTYDAHGSPTQIALTGGVGLSYAYDPAMRRLQSAALQGPAGLVRRLSLEYDPCGNVTTLRDELPGETLARRFTYDRLYRLGRSELYQGSLAGPLLRDDGYGYTPAGDLIRNGEALAGPMVYGDPAHAGRLTAVQPTGAPAPAALSYDAAGRLTGFDDLAELRYDIWDRPVAVTRTDGSVVRFAYDHQGARVRKAVQTAAGTQATLYVENLYEAGPEGARLNVYLGRLLVATRQVPIAGAAQTAFVLTDHLGSVLAACDTAGAALHQQLYSPFGLRLRAGSSADRYHGLGRDDELGLTQCGARYYAPLLGRFVTPDWFIIENPRRALHLPQGLNAYSYAINNPLALRDPSGLWFGIDDLIVAAVGFVVGFVAGTIYGLATGEGWNSLLIGLEAGLVGAAGAWLAWNTAGLALGVLGVSTTGGVGFGIMVGAAVVGGLNGVISGMTQIYAWDSPDGWLAFLADSTWGLVGTAMGELVHTVNLFYGNRNYRSDLSKRQNRHVYDGGFGFGNFAFTQGNVISNLQGRTSLLNHETLHVWQSRLFGPIFQTTYVAWLVVGAVVGFGIGLFTSQPLGQDIEDVAYLDNPWETWAYSVGGTPSGGELSWT